MKKRSKSSKSYYVVSIYESFSLLITRVYIDVDLVNKDCYYADVKHPKVGSSHKKRGVFNLRSWLLPGLGVKRWLLLVLGGTTLIGIGLGILILDYYRNAPDSWWLPVVSAASLRIFPRIVRVIIFGGIGLSVLFIGLWGLNRALMKPFVKPGSSVVDVIRQHRQRERGPRIVVIGGGHGLSTLLRGLKNYSYNITAVVTVADDGGSSGRIRNEMGFLPPGDVRNCLAALSEDEALLGQLFQYRFPVGDGLQGHSFGNLFISALADITGSFEQAVAESGRVLAIHGEVLPSSIHNVHLQADVLLPYVANEVRVAGESRIPESNGTIRRVWLVPDNVPAFPKVLQAILGADIIVIGPGSLYTSILPNLLVREVAQAIEASRAFKVFICNIASQPGETDGMNCKEHIEALNGHVGVQLFDVCVCNISYDGELPHGVDWVKVDRNLMEHFPIYATDLVDITNSVRHDPNKLAQTIIDLYQEKTGPLVE